MKAEIILCIIIRDILYHTPQSLFICRILSIFYPAANEITHDSSEILMSCIGQKASRIGEHSNEIAKQSKTCQRSHLIDHTLFVIVKPPCTSLLDLAGNLCSLETSEDRSDRLVIIWIQGVENRFLKFIRRDQ